MLQFFLGFVSCYALMGFVLWLCCRSEVLTDLQEEAASEGRVIPAWQLNALVFLICVVGWLYLIRFADNLGNSSPN